MDATLEAVELADLALEALELELQEADAKTGLRHPSHARRLKPLYRKVRKLLAGYFDSQGEAIEVAVKPWIELHLQSHRVSEAEETAEEKAARITALNILPDTVTPLSYSVTAAESSQYQAIVRQAIAEAESQLQREMDLAGRIPETVMGKYLQDNSLSKLTGNLEETTKQRLRDAIAEAVESGGTAEDIVTAIRDSVDDFSTVRANMIAQSEINTAYNFGRDALAREAGLDEKSWQIESLNPCVVCIENSLEGWIPIGDAFPSGDQIPTAHPNCMCTVDFRKVA